MEFNKSSQSRVEKAPSQMVATRQELSDLQKRAETAWNDCKKFQNIAETHRTRALERVEKQKRVAEKKAQAETFRTGLAHQSDMFTKYDRDKDGLLNRSEV